MTNEPQVYIEKWKSLPWKDFEKTLFRLQHRLYKASKEGNWDKCTKLQSLILGSACSRYLAVRQISQLNTGKKTAGMDGKRSLTPQERLILANDLKLINQWKHQPLRRVHIPKSDGEFRPLGIPTLNDRAMQCLLKYALEPYYEAIASHGSWGFRPGRCAHDVQKIIFINLSSNANGHNKSILELDIEKCFDKIDHDKLLKLILLPNSAKGVLRSALKAGVLNERIRTLEGTPQGGVISPLLCNLALNGIEDLHNEIRGSAYKQRGLRYADDMVFFLKPGEDSKGLRSKLEHFLEERGLRIKESKTQLVKSTEGFDFLDWHFKVKANNQKFVCYPTKKSRLSVIKMIKTTMRESRRPVAARLEKAKAQYRGWWNYHQYCDMSQINVWSMSDWVYRFGKKRTKMDKDKLLRAVRDIFNGHTYKVNGHVSVRHKKSPFDGDWVYWSKRQDHRYSTLVHKMAKRQEYQCASCNLYFSSKDKVELHHVDGNSKNNLFKNLQVLHRFCHQQESNHGKKKQSMVAH